jgi:AcrR family transcriptional regulator
MTETASRRTQEERRSEAEQRLLLAAAELVGEIGPAGVTLANVGERAGYSRGLATHHFGSKGALMQRLVDSVTAEFREAVPLAGEPHSVLDDALRLVDVYLGVLADPQPANRARLALWADTVASATSDLRPAMIAADREFRGAIADSLQRGIDNGELAASVHPDGLATVIVGMLRGVALQALLDADVDLVACHAEIRALLAARLREAR